MRFDRDLNGVSSSRARFPSASEPCSSSASLSLSLSLYDDYAKRNGVLPVPRNSDAARRVEINGLRGRAGPGLLVAILLLATLLPVFILSRKARA